MIRYIINRLLLTIPVVIAVSVLVFLFIHLIPGDPVEMMLGETATIANVEEIRHMLGLDKPLGIQFLDFMKNLLKGDLGKSIVSRRPVMQIVLERYPATIKLTVASAIVALIISIPLGTLAAVKHYSWIDNLSMIFALLGVSMPNFWLGPLLIILFSLTLGWLPPSGYGGFKYIILPAITLGTAMSASLTRLVRSSMLEVLDQEYIKTARAKGLRERLVIYRHALRNALIPVITVFGMQIGSLLSGALITETIFSWPGVGRLFIESIFRRDFPLVQGCVLIIALTYVFVNFIVDITYGFINPKIRYE
ncbi:MAG TPA: ABC transporter permease [Thermotogaceae bacterium]|nr:ABC transporter permease [Thermotogota bacterium]HEW92362.1 ABC transporter permease [Thermotogaceae bacterium]